MKKLLCYLIILSIAFLALHACKKMDDNYKKFIVPGGLTYPQKATSAVAYSGHNRVKISWLRGNDPTVIIARIFWNNYADSVEISIPAKGDTVSTTIDDLPEKSYTFYIVTYDAKGNSSVPVEILGASYGDNYQASLLNRLITLAALGPQGQVTVHWGAANTFGGAYATEVQYTDTTGNVQSLQVPVSDSVSFLPDMKQGAPLEYRTVYIPDSLSIDTFYTSYEENKEYLLDKSHWQALHLPTDTYQPAAANFNLERLWDGVITNYDGIFASANASTLPQWFTIDLGQQVLISRIVEHQQQSGHLYQGGAVKTFELWGSNNPNPDGSWAGWDSLGTFHSFKPSGLPLGQVSGDDTNYGWQEGEDFEFGHTLLAYRYIRWKTLDTYGSNTAGPVVIAEIDLYGQLQP